MNIAGVQALSLLDYPGKPCSIIFTQGCIFRCAYCHNPELIPLDAKPAQAVPDVLAFLDERKNIVDAVCITGGEPTIQKGLVDFIGTLNKKGFSVKLDTNGIRPDIVKKLIDARLVDYFAMDLKAPWYRYRDVIRVGNDAIGEAVKETFALIQSSGIDHEFRTTILPGVHTADDFLEMAGYLYPGEHYFIQRTSFKKTLEPLEMTNSIDTDRLKRDLEATYPSLMIGIR